MSVLVEETLEWGHSHQVPGCNNATCNTVYENDSGSADTSGESVHIFTFDRHFCNKLTRPGVVRYIENQTETCNELTMKLVVGDWICIDSNDEGEPIWLGRVMSNPYWGGKGMFKNETTWTIQYDNVTELTRGDDEIYVMWYEKIDINLDAHDYHV